MNDITSKIYTPTFGNQRFEETTGTPMFTNIRVEESVDPRITGNRMIEGKTYEPPFGNQMKIE